MGEELTSSVVHHVINAIVTNKDVFIIKYQSELLYLDIESAPQSQLIKAFDRQYEILRRRHRVVQVPGRRDVLRFRWARLFGVSYLKAFSYLASPRLSMQRIEEYPR